MWEQAWKKVWKEKTSCHHLPKITNVAFPLLLLLFPSYFPPPSSLAHTCPFLFHWGTDHLSIVQLVLVRVNWLAAERGGVLKCVFLRGGFVSGWGSHASSELIPVISTIMRCTRRSLPACPPASVTNCHHPGGQTRTLSRTLTHWWDSSPSPHTCSCRHTDSYSPGKERRKEGRIRRISHLLLRPLYVVLILGAEQKKQAHHSCARTHLYPRSHGLLD